MKVLCARHHRDGDLNPTMMPALPGGSDKAALNLKSETRNSKPETRALMYGAGLCGFPGGSDKIRALFQGVAWPRKALKLIASGQVDFWWKGCGKPCGNHDALPGGSGQVRASPLRTP